MSTQEIAAQLEALKAQMAIAKKAESEAERSEAVTVAKRKGELLVDETMKTASTMVENAKAKATSMVEAAMAKAAVMLDRAEKGLTQEPANPSRPRKGRVLEDGKVVPLGRGKPAAAWKIVDLDTVDPSLIVAPVKATTPVVEAPLTSSVANDTVTFVLKGGGAAVEIISND